MGILNKMVHPIKKEFYRKSCGFDHDQADDFVKSQWQSCTKSTAYLIYRWLIALFFIAVVIESMLNTLDYASFWLYFIYLTNWGILLCMITNIYGAILVTLWHYLPEYADNLLNMNSLISPFRIYWTLHVTTLDVSLSITALYWGLIYNETEILSATNILTHAFNSIIMFIDLLIVAHPIRLLHFFFPVALSVIYIGFSIIYHLCGGLNKKRQQYIYKPLNWNESENAIVYAIAGITLSCIIYVILFFIYKLRTIIYRFINNSTYILPTSISTMAESSKGIMEHNHVNGGIRHSPSGISMVLGNYNQAFNSSTENITEYHKISQN